MLTNLLIVAGLVALNAFFAMAELALVTARRGRLRKYRHLRGARLALAFSGAPGHLFSVLQTGVTLTSLAAAAFSGASLALPLERVLLSWFPATGENAEAIALALVVAILSLVTLIFGELLPKRLAVAYPEPIAIVVAIPVHWIARVAGPLVALLSWVTDALLRLMGLRGNTDPGVTGEEIRHILEEGVEKGAFGASERVIIERAVRLGQKTAGDIMTPRNQIVWLNRDAPVGENLAIIRDAGHSRYPVTGEGGAGVLGILKPAGNLVRLLDGDPGGDGKADLLDGLEPPLFVPETAAVASLIGQLRHERRYMALIVDEYGDVTGMATRNDVAQAVLGEATLNDDEDAPEVRMLPDGSLLVDGLVSVDDLREHLNLEELPGEGAGDFNTVAGMVLELLGRIPEQDETLDAGRLSIRILEMQGPRIARLRITPLPRPGDPEQRLAS